MAESFKIRLESEADVTAWVQAEKSLEALERSSKELEAQLMQADPNSEEFATLSRSYLQASKDAEVARKAIKALHVEAGQSVKAGKVEVPKEGLGQNIKQGVGISIGDKMVEGLGSIPGILKDIVVEGFEYNKLMHDSESAIAKTLESTDKLSEAAAKNKAADLMKQIEAAEPGAAATMETLMDGFLGTATSARQAGLTYDQNVQIIAKMSNVMANLKLDASELGSELGDILDGEITSDSQLAKRLEIKPEDIAKAKEAGRVYEFLIEKMGKRADAGDSYEAKLSSLSSAVSQAKGALAKPLMEPLIQGAEKLAAVLKQDDVQQGLKSIGVAMGEVVKTGVDLLEWAAKNSEMLLNLATSLLKVGGAFAGLKLASGVMSSIGSLAPGKAFGGLSQAALTAGSTAGDQAAKGFGSKFAGGLATLGATVGKAVVAWELGKLIGESINEGFKYVNDGKSIGDSWADLLVPDDSNRAYANVAKTQKQASGDIFAAKNVEELSAALSRAKTAAQELRDAAASGFLDEGDAARANSFADSLERLVGKHQSQETLTARVAANMARMSKEAEATAAHIAKEEAARKEAEAKEEARRAKARQARDQLFGDATAETGEFKFELDGNVETAREDTAADLAKKAAEIREARKELEKALGTKPGESSQFEGLSGEEILKKAKEREDASRAKEDQDKKAGVSPAKEDKPKEGNFSDEALKALGELIAAEKEYQGAIEDEKKAQEELKLKRLEAAKATQLLEAQASGDTAAVATLEAEIAKLNDAREALEAVQSLNPDMGDSEAKALADKQAETQAKIRQRAKDEKAESLQDEETLLAAKLAAAKKRGSGHVDNDPLVKSLELDKSAKEMAKRYEEAGLAYGEEALEMAKSRLAVEQEIAGVKKTEERQQKTMDRLSKEAQQKGSRGSKARKELGLMQDVEAAKDGGNDGQLAVAQRRLADFRERSGPRGFTGIEGFNALQGRRNLVANALATPLQGVQGNQIPNKAKAPDVDTSKIATAGDRTTQAIKKVEAVVVSKMQGFTQALDGLAKKIGDVEYALKAGRN